MAIPAAISKAIGPPLSLVLGLLIRAIIALGDPCVRITKNRPTGIGWLQVGMALEPSSCS